MIDKEQNITVNTLLDEVQKSVSELGVEETITGLQAMREKPINFTDPRVDFTIKTICNIFNVTVSEVITWDRKTLKNRCARLLIIFYLYNNFKISLIQLSILFKRNRSVIWKSYQEIKNYEQYDNSEIIAKHKPKIDLLINEFKISKT